MFATIGPDDFELRRMLREACRGAGGVPAVFLDRDDTLCRCTGHAPGNDLGDPGLVELLPGVTGACEALMGAGYRLVAITNQGGVARGRYGVEAVRRTCLRLQELLGGRLSAAYFCPYHPNGTVEPWIREHPWRKPAPGMLRAAAEDLGLDLFQSWTIGDKPRDGIAGLAAGTKAILLTATISDLGRGNEGDGPELEEGLLHRVPTVVEAAELILRGNS